MKENPPSALEGGPGRVSHGGMTSTAEQDSNGPAFVAWNFRDFDDATDEWDTRTVGAYVRLLHRQARKGSIPIGDLRHLAVLIHEDEKAFASMWVKCLRDKFPPAEDNPQRGINPRMERERSKAIAKASRARTNGRSGGRPRKPTGLPTGVPSHLSSSTSSLSESSEREVPPWEMAAEQLGWRDSPSRREALAVCETWATYRRESRWRPYLVRTWKTQLKKATDDPALFAASVEHSIGQGYKGIFPPNGNGRAKKPSTLDSLDAKVRAYQERQQGGQGRIIDL